MISPESIFIIITIIICFNYLLDRFLDYLNSKRWSKSLPAELAGIYDAEKYEKSQRYLKVNNKFGQISGGFSFLIMLLMLFLGGFAVVDSWTVLISANVIVSALVFFGILAFASDLLSLPFSLYHVFVIEQNFGFNRTSGFTFLMDKIKGWLLGLLIGGGIGALVIWIYTLSENWFWLIAWAVVTAFMIFMNMFYSSLIVPLFNKQTPLPEGELRTAIEDFSMNVGFKLANIYVIDGSKRSRKANAYFAGLGPRKRIVLYDTLINDHTVPELVAVLAHEIGHYKKKHTLNGLLISVAETGLMLYLLGLFLSLPEISMALGGKAASFHMGALGFALLYSPFSMLLSLATNYISRKHEYAADRYAGTHYDAEALKSALKKLSVNNLSNLNPHPAYVFFHYSHPTLLQRLKALDTVAPNQTGSLKSS
ncbi:MAG: M48 family metallopeptidase [Bacteroidota bacterium]